MRLLLARGAEPTARTRSDDYETARKAAQRAGHRHIVELLTPHEGRAR